MLSCACVHHSILVFVCKIASLTADASCNLLPVVLSQQVVSGVVSPSQPARSTSEGAWQSGSVSALRRRTAHAWHPAPSALLYPARLALRQTRAS
eukprot:COSAG02_NODE_2499_length_8675_cov_3.161147_3_plen_95_part_00